MGSVLGLLRWQSAWRILQVMANNHDTCEVRQEDLIAVWKVLETLTVSLDRMGHFWLVRGEDAAKEALHKFMRPVMFDTIAQARQTLVTMLEGCDPTILEQLELLSADEREMGYWQGSEVADT